MTESHDGGNDRGPQQDLPPVLHIDFTWLVQAVFAMLWQEASTKPCAPCAKTAAVKMRDQALGKTDA